jgi:toxin-antitoxin system PIN domain toxin
MRRLLLDVNVWVALFDDAHIHSRRANALLAEPGLKIASCPLVENGVIRVLNLPAYGRIGPLGLDRVRRQLQRACAELDHEFWPDDISLRDESVADWSRIRGHQQITDVYLLALAVRHAGSLVSFDQAISLSAVRGATPEHFRVL